MQGKKQYEEKLFTQVRLSRRIPNDNPYKVLKRQLNLKFIYRLTKDYYGKTGKQSLDPVVFFKLLLIKEWEKQASDKKLIELCKIRLDILYFLGYNLDDKLPHWNTIYRTRKHFPEELINSILDSIKSQVEEQESKPNYSPL